MWHETAFRFNRSKRAYNAQVVPAPGLWDLLCSNKMQYRFNVYVGTIVSGLRTETY